MVANMYFGYVHAGVPLNTEAEVRYTAVGANQNGVALCCSMSILFAFYLITRRDKTGFELPNWFYWGFIVAAGLAVPLTGSRTGVLSAGVAGFMLLGGLRKLTWKSRLGLAVSVVLVAILVPLFVSGTIINRISQGTRSSSFVDRIKGWEVGLKDWTKTPLLGVGAGSYQDLMTQHGESANVAHNTFVGVLVESGLVGFVVYFSFWAIIIRRVMRLPKADRFFWLGAFAAYLPAMIAGSAEYEKLWWFLGAMVLCQAPQQGAAYARKQRIVSSAGQGPALPLLDHRP
jgi:O-antigen ligase